MASLPGGAGRPRHLLRPALSPQPGDARHPRRDPDARATASSLVARRDHAIHQAVLDQHRAVQQPDRAQVRAEAVADELAEAAADCGGNGARFRLQRRRVGSGADRAIRADVLRPVGRSDGDVQDARRRSRHPARRARTTCTTASRWRISTAFDERYPLNSRVVKRDGRIVEEVYRVGGLYDAEIRAHRRRTSKMRCRTRRRRWPRRCARLIRWYQTGEDADRQAFDIAWVQNRDSAVDTMNGFIEVYMDARGIKGAWEGVVYYVNHEKTEKIHRLADQRAVVRGSSAGRSAVPQAAGAGHLGARHRGGVRNRRFGPGHADRRQPAQRSAYPRAVRQQVGVAVERHRGLRTVHARQLPAGVLVERRRNRARARSGARLPAS